MACPRAQLGPSLAGWGAGVALASASRGQHSPRLSHCPWGSAQGLAGGRVWGSFYQLGSTLTASKGCNKCGLLHGGSAQQVRKPTRRGLIRGRHPAQDQPGSGFVISVLEPPISKAFLRPPALSHLSQKSRILWTVSCGTTAQREAGRPTSTSFLSGTILQGTSCLDSD